LEFKLHQQRSEIMAMPFWEAKMRIRQLMKYYEEKNKVINETTSKIKKPSSSFHIPRGRI